MGRLDTLDPRRARIDGALTFPEHAQRPYIEAWLRAGATLSEAIHRGEWGIMPVSGAGVETGQVVLQNVPIGAYRISPQEFFAATERNVFRVDTFAWSTGNPWRPVQIPQVGILSKLILQCELSIVQTTAVGTTTQKWPYGALSSLSFTANGQDDLFSAQGISFKVLERVRYPGMIESFDDDSYTPALGAGGTVATGTTVVRLTYEIPLAFDEATLVGSVFAQSRALNLLLKGQDAAIADIITNTTGTTAITGTWSVLIETFQVPIDREQRLVIPDLRFLHGFNEIRTQFSGAGDVRTPLVRVAGTLQRLYTQVVLDSVNPVDYLDWRATTEEANSWRLEFGGNKRPYQYAPAATVVSRNVRDYGDVLPYSYIVLDLARYNPVRDAINMAGVTELYDITDVASGLTLDAAEQRVIEETLFA